MKHLLLILGLVCLGIPTSTANNSTFSFWQTVFPDAFSEVEVSSSSSTSTTTLLSNCSVACVIADSLELKKLIESTNIEIIDPSWNLNTPVCTWGGLTIDANGFVTIFNNRNKNISGMLPADFGANGLTELTEFKISQNNLIGSIPSTMGNLSKLSSLWLDDNQFTGSIPTELGFAPELAVLWLDNNKFSGPIPQNFLDLDKLRELSLYNNCLDSLPDFSSSSVTDISQTNSIVCYDNKFTFDDLVPNASFMNRPGQNLYSPQATFTIPATAALQTGDIYTIDLGIDSSILDNVYRWTKDGLPFGLTTVNRLDLSPVRFEDAGVYCCFVTNPQLPLLELVSTCQTITVTCGTSTEIRNDVVCAGGFINIDGIDYGDPAAGYPRTGSVQASEDDQYGCDSMIIIDLVIMSGMPTNYEPMICADDTVFVNGTAYHFENDEGTETFNIGACDSIVEVNLDFFPASTNTIDGIYCRSDTVYVDGIAYYFGNASGSQTLLNDNFRGCDSTVTINLDFHPAYEGTDNRQLCSGQSVFINGTEYGESPLPQSGLERIKDVAPNGCDSLITVEITIVDGITVERNDVLCPGQTITVNNVEYGESPLDQMGSQTMMSTSGCDSTVIIDISFQNQITDNFVPFFCYDDIIVINGTTYGNPAVDPSYQQSGMETISGTDGCDTLRNIFINFYPLSEVDINLVICEGGSVLFNGNFYDEGTLTGIETIEGVDPNGCDSIYNVTVEVYTPMDANITPQVCPGDDFDLNGRIFDADDPTGTVVLAGDGFGGCDSTVNVELSFYDSLKGNFTRTICNNDNFIYNGSLYGDGGADSGMEVIDNAGANGCDSFIQVTVNYFPAITGDTIIRLCPNESVVFDNTLYGSQDGGVDNGFETLEGEGFGGCDSTVNVIVIYEPNPSPGFYEERICRTDTLFFNGTAYHLDNTSGTENLGTIAFNGCDSLVEVNVRFFPQVLNREDPTLCSGSTIEINGTIYGEAPMYLEYDSIVLENRSSRGCDSIIVVDLSFNSFVENNITGDYCGCEEVTIGGQTYDCNNPSDIITFMGGSYTGCDSIVNINLTYNEAPVIDLIDTLCPGETITIRGTVYGESLRTGTEIFPAATAAGCDSTVIIDLDFYEVETRTITATICQGDSILVGDTYYKFAGIFNEVVPMATPNDCDSILVLDLTVTQPEPVELDNLGEICSSANPIELPNPQSGVNGNWSGVGVDDNMFDPSTLSNNITLTFTPTDGCAEPNSTDITISSFSSSMITDSICPGETLIIPGIDIDITMPGIYRDTLGGVTATGCDSLIIIEILAKTPVDVLLENIPALCAGENPITLNTTQDGVMGTWSGDGVIGGNMFDPNGLSGTITLTFIPSETGCFAATETEVTINDGGAIELEILPAICSLDDPIIIDNIQNGTEGTWTGDGITGNEFDPSMASGTVALTFTPTNGGCVTANSTTIEVTAAAPVSLTSLGMVCGSNPIALPPTTPEGIAGIWSGQNVTNNEFNPIALIGEIELTFTPTNGGCLAANSTTIEVTAGTPVPLNPLGMVCGNNPVDLPIPVSGGIWSGLGVNPAGNQFNPATLNGEIELTFTPNGDDCLTANTTNIIIGEFASSLVTESICVITGETVTINDTIYSAPGIYMDTIINGSIAGCDSIINITITDAIQAITLEQFEACNSGGTVELPLIQDGIAGSWTGTNVTGGNIFDPAGLNGSISLQFNPNPGICVMSETTNIQVSDATTPVMLDPLPGLCNSGGIFMLPMMQDGVNGTWTGTNVSGGNSFDPIEDGSFNLTFTPDAGSCRLADSTTIEVGGNTMTNLEATICDGEIYTLNNIDYTTSGTYMQTLPGAANDCDTLLTLNLTVGNTAYALDDFNSLCASADPFSLPTLQDGINGNWEGTGILNNSNTFDPNELSGSISITFVPDAGSCADPLTTTIEITENTIIDLEATICDGEIYTLNNTDYTTAGTFMQTLPGIANDCDTLLNLILNVETIENLPAANAGNDQEICGDETNLSAITSNGITGFWETIIGSPMIMDETNPTTNIGDLQEDEYQLRWVVSSEFCPEYDQDTVNISVAMEELLAVTDSFILFDTNPTIELDLTANDDLPENFVVTILNQPLEGTIENIEPGIYEYTAATDFEAGQLILGYQVCSVNCPDICSQATVIIDLEKDNRPVIEVPSGITPNGDDKNEQLVIPAIRDNPELYEQAELIVFSRWGDVIFQAQPYTNNWDGSGPNGKIVPQGTYYYVLKLNLGEGVIYRGDITVLR